MADHTFPARRRRTRRRWPATDRYRHWVRHSQRSQPCARHRGHAAMPQNLWWVQLPMENLAIATLQAAAKEFHGDPQRTYLTGLSMGGYGAWYLAQKYPGRFAALIVICGGIRPSAATLKTHPELAKLTPPDN